MWAVIIGLVSIFQSKLPSVTEGDVIVAAEPDAAFHAVTDYNRWPQIFKNVRRAVIGENARVTFVHDDGSTDVLQFKNRDDQHLVWFKQIGGDADVWGETTFSPGPEPGTTHVHTRFYADVSGVSSWFVSDSKVRHLREKQVRDDLSQLAAYFSKR